MDELAIRRPQQATRTGSAVSTSGCCLSLGVDGTIVWAAEASRALGWAPEELAGRDVSVLFPRLVSMVLGPADRARMLSWRHDAFTVVDVGVERSGRLFEAAIDVTAKRSPAGEVTGLVIVARDVTAELLGRRSRRLARDREPVVVLGRDLDVRYATRPAVQMLGLGPADVFPGTRAGLIHPDDRTAVTESMNRLLVDPSRVERVMTRLRLDGGRWSSVEATVSNCLADPDLRGLVARLRAVSPGVDEQHEASLSAALHRAIVETSEEGIIVTGDDGTTRYANLAIPGILGISAAEVYDVDLPGLLGATGALGGREEIVYAHPDGIDRILAVTWHRIGDEGAGLGSLLTVADVTESRLTERDLQLRALHDPLTGLPNRYLVRERLEQAAARDEQSRYGDTAVFFIDLDDFKPINDRLGHGAGDQVLGEVAVRLRSAVRGTDMVGRVGGDEFVVICEDIDRAVTSAVASRILAVLDEPFELTGVRLDIGASVGIALAPPYSFDGLLQEADAAMYRAKRAGGRQVVFAGS
jgi:diguanylate cyclase (GGDEF)-like protein/PAS domain S-box-containing protein